MAEGLITLLIWAGILVGIGLLIIGLVVAGLFLGMRHYYPDEYRPDRRK